MSKKKNRNRPYRQTAPGVTAQRAAEAGAAVPQDRLQQAEATDGTVTVDYRGFHIELDADDLDDYDAMSQFAQGVPTQLLAIIFPDESGPGSCVSAARTRPAGSGSPSL